MEWTCTKQPLDRRVANQIVRRANRRSGRLNAYRCEQCRAWHVGNKRIG